MNVVFEVAGGQEGELENLESALREESTLTGRVRRVPGRVPEGSLGTEAVLEFLGQNVVLPVLIQAAYDYVMQRRRTRSGADLRVTLIRTDLADGNRRVELSVQAEPDEVVEAARKVLE